MSQSLPKSRFDSLAQTHAHARTRTSRTLETSTYQNNSEHFRRCVTVACNLELLAFFTMGLDTNVDVNKDGLLHTATKFVERLNLDNIMFGTEEWERCFEQYFDDPQSDSFPVKWHAEYDLRGGHGTLSDGKQCISITWTCQPPQPPVIPGISEWAIASYS